MDLLYVPEKFKSKFSSKVSSSAFESILPDDISPDVYQLQLNDIFAENWNKV